MLVVTSGLMEGAAIDCCSAMGWRDAWQSRVVPRGCVAESVHGILKRERERGREREREHPLAGQILQEGEVWLNMLYLTQEGEV
jgi:hypothetical protein